MTKQRNPKLAKTLSITSALAAKSTELTQAVSDKQVEAQSYLDLATAAKGAATLSATQADAVSKALTILTDAGVDF